MLKIEKREETRVPLDDAGAFIILDPITPKMRRRVFKMYRQALVQAGVDPAELAKGATLDADLVGDLGELISFELIRMGAREWGGIGDADDNPLAMTPDQATRMRTATDPERPTGTLDALLADESIFDAIDADYVKPDANRRAEKNASSGSPNGTSAAATPGSATANSRAKRKPAGAAKNARTASTNRRPKKAKGSGRS
jgi:hypothetical protein